MKDLGKAGLGDLEDLADVGGISVGVLGIRRIDPPGDLAAAVGTRVAFRPEVDAHAAAAGRGVDNVDGLIIIVVDFELRDAAGNKIEKKLNMGSKTPSEHSGTIVETG